MIELICLNNTSSKHESILLYLYLKIGAEALLLQDKLFSPGGKSILVGNLKAGDLCLPKLE